MTTRSAMSITICALAAGAMTGCSTSTVARAQNAAIQPTGFEYHDPYRPGGPVQNAADHVYGEHTTFHEGVAPAGYGNCPNGTCPPQGYAGGPGCPPGAGGHGHFGHIGPDGDWYPTHRYSYSYKTPQNLEYPPPQVPGGAVVYPYYTHKGPSDFFRKH